MPRESFLCRTCGSGTVASRAVAGRTFLVKRGVRWTVPAEMALRTCDNCLAITANVQELQQLVERYDAEQRLRSVQSNRPQWRHTCESRNASWTPVPNFAAYFAGLIAPKMAHYFVHEHVSLRPVCTVSVESGARSVPRSRYDATHELPSIEMPTGLVRNA